MCADENMRLQLLLVREAHMPRHLICHQWLMMLRSERWTWYVDPARRLLNKTPARLLCSLKPKCAAVSVSLRSNLR